MNQSSSLFLNPLLHNSFAHSLRRERKEECNHQFFTNSLLPLGGRMVHKAEGRCRMVMGKMESRRPRDKSRRVKVWFWEYSTGLLTAYHSPFSLWQQLEERNIASFALNSEKTILLPYRYVLLLLIMIWGKFRFLCTQNIYY